jgi:hypothetical protein
MISFSKCRIQTKDKTLLKRPPPRPRLLKKQKRVRPGRDADASVGSSVVVVLDVGVAVDVVSTGDKIFRVLDGEVHQFHLPMKTKKMLMNDQLKVVKRKKGLKN